MSTDFLQFSVGDRCVFERKFSSDDFVAFSRISGDKNPLHHDATHARSTGMGSPIVPLHLTLAPLSMIAGMVLPGEPSLYLGHEVRASSPVFYGQTLTYSAVVRAINAEHRILELRVLALRGVDVVLDAHLRVQATAERWASAPALPIVKSDAPASAVVTGAGGAIGRAIALSLAAKGWSLILQERTPGRKGDVLRASLTRMKAGSQFVHGDLGTAEGRIALDRALAARSDIEAVFHCASPRIDASLESLVAVNYQALKVIGERVFPQMLARQRGSVVLLSSTAVNLSVPGMEHYSAAKTMATAVINSIERGGAAYGVRGLVLMAGFVATPFSQSARGDAPALSPPEVAESAIDMIERPPTGNAVVLEVGRRVEGQFGFRSVRIAEVRSTEGRAYNPSGNMPGTGVHLPQTGGDQSISQIVTQILRLPRTYDMSDAGLGVTPGWDSLKQVEIVLGLEEALGIRLASRQLTALTRFAELEEACRRILAERSERVTA